MPAIVHVHGTFASGEEAGEKWWQEGSPFEIELRGLLEAETGELTFRRVHWSGDNKESARRTAAGSLLEELKELETSGEPYCIIAHSHGGSAVLAGLFEAASAGNELPNLKRWITVATPFIEFQKQQFLFSRLGRPEQALMIATVTFFLLTAITSTLSFGFLWALPFWLMGVLPYALVHGLLWYRNRKRYRHYDAGVRERCVKMFSGRWLGLWHRNDEAISGLKNLGGLNRPIFGPEFAVPILSALAVVVLPLALSWLLASSTAMTFVRDLKLSYFDCATLTEIVPCEGRLVGGLSSIGAHYNLIVTFGWELLAAQVPGGKSSVAALFYYLVLVPAAFCSLATLIILPLLRFFAVGVSPTLSKGLNGATWGQLKQTAWGGNVTGEAATAANSYPELFGRGFAPLPAALEEQISEVSDEAAAEVLPKLRQALGEIAFSEGEASADAIADYLSWRELIHTSYFSVPSFVVLLASAISKEDGFKATSSFQRKTLHKQAADWQNELQDSFTDNTH